MRNYFEWEIQNIIFKLLSNFNSVTSPSPTIIKKENSDGSLAWLSSFTVTATIKGLELDSSETNLYFCRYTTTFQVFRLSASTGALVSVQR